MSHRFPLVATVVGALLIGGATTGTTLALWRDQATLAQSQVQSGSIELKVNGTTTAVFTNISNLALNNGSTPGTAQTFTATLAAGGTGKNLRMRMFVDDVTADNGDLNNGLEIALSGAATAADCPAATTASYTALSVTNSVQVTDSSAAGVVAGTSRILCVAVRVKANAPAATAGKSGQLSFAFRGQQVRP